MFFKRANSVEKQLLNFRNASVSQFQKFVAIIWNTLGLSNRKRMKRNLVSEKKNIFYETSFINVQKLPRTMEWLRDATNAL